MSNQSQRSHKTIDNRNHLSQIFFYVRLSFLLFLFSFLLLLVFILFCFVSLICLCDSIFITTTANTQGMNVRRTTTADDDCDDDNCIREKEEKEKERVRNEMKNRFNGFTIYCYFRGRHTESIQYSRTDIEWVAYNNENDNGNDHKNNLQRLQREIQECENFWFLIFSFRFLLLRPDIQCIRCLLVWSTLHQHQHIACWCTTTQFTYFSLYFFYFILYHFVLSCQRFWWLLFIELFSFVWRYFDWSNNSTTHMMQ